MCHGQGSEGNTGYSINPRRNAIATAPALVFTDNSLNIEQARFLTCASLVPRSAAVSLYVRELAASCRILRSAVVMRSKYHVLHFRCKAKGEAAESLCLQQTSPARHAMGMVRAHQATSESHSQLHVDADVRTTLRFHDAWDVIDRHADRVQLILINASLAEYGPARNAPLQEDPKVTGVDLVGGPSLL
jgi:hypothetical protein